MTVALVYPENGRGAWSYKKPFGGTLSSDGREFGQYYRLDGVGRRKVGKVAFDAVEDGDEVSINHYAVYRAVAGIQREVGVEQTGVFDKITSDAVKRWQISQDLLADGIYGRISARRMWVPIAIETAEAKDEAHPDLVQLVLGHISWESLWDPGAVGGLTPTDLGLGQINGPAHPDLTADQRLDPRFAIKWVVNFVDSNLVAMNYVIRDAVAAYNLGQGGARQWITAGRPDVWTRVVDGVSVTTAVKKYIDSVLNAYR